MNQHMIESFVPPVYARTPRNTEAYRATYRYCHDRLEGVLEIYGRSTNDQQTLRLIRDDIDNLLRRYHGYCVKERIGAHYVEIGCTDEIDFEHLIPAARVRDMLISGHMTIDQALNCPTVNLSRAKHQDLKEAGWASHTPNMWLPFQRYSQVFDAVFQTHDGTVIDPLTWTLDMHYNYFQHMIIR